MKFSSILLGIALPMVSLMAQDLSLYEKRVFADPQEGQLPYRILYPENYDRNQVYPLVLFFHGAGERGEDNEKQLTHGAGLFLDPAVRAKYPAIVVFPQCATEDYWVEVGRRHTADDPEWEFPFFEQPNPSMHRTIQLLGQLLQEESIDRNRMYVMGLSMGGFGTFEILSRFPGRFAAAVPICGGGNGSLAHLYAPATSLWVFHGAKDNVVPPENSRKMYLALKNSKADVKYTEYPEANHNSWDPAFAEPELLPWLFGQSLQKGRYREPTFAQVNKQTLEYAAKGRDSLLVDLYTPAGDLMTNRPLILYVHGGGFSGGQRDEPYISQFAHRAAGMGYVVASMSYRLTMKGKSFSCDQPAPNKIRTFQAAVEDIRDATIFILQQALEWHVDPDRIVLAGSSAGAEAVLHAAYWADSDLPAGSPKLPPAFRYAGVISMAGAIVDTCLINQETAIPTLLFHGTCDNLVPYGTASHHYCKENSAGYLLLHGGRTIAERLQDIGQPFFLVSACTGGHDWAGRPLVDQVDTIMDFLYQDVLRKTFRQVHFSVDEGKTCTVGDHWLFCR